MDYFKSRNIVNIDSTLITTGYYKYILIESIIYALHPSPMFLDLKFTLFSNYAKTHYTHNFNDILHITTILLRLLIVCRILLMKTHYFTTSS